MKHDITKPDLDVFQKAAVAHGLLPRTGEQPDDPRGKASGPANLALSFPAGPDTDLDEVLPALAAMVVDLVEIGPQQWTRQCGRGNLLALRTSLDRLYPASVWSDTTMEIGGRFAWAIRERIAQRLQDLE